MPVGGDEHSYFFDWRSSSAPKKDAAARKISFARASSRFSLRTAASCARRSSVVPGNLGGVALGAASFTQLYRVTGLTFTRAPRRSHAAFLDSSGPDLREHQPDALLLELRGITQHLWHDLILSRT